MLDFISAERDVLLAIMSALSVFSAVIVVSWPFLAPDTRAIRMRRIATERERLRVRERERLKPVARPRLLQPAPKRFLKAIIERLDLTRLLTDEETARRLRMAGYRGQATLTSFVAFRLLAPLVIFPAAFLYAYLIVATSQPLMVQLLIAAGAAGAGYYLPDLLLKNAITKRQQKIVRAWPDALDLLLICIESGMSVEAAFRKVAEEIGAQSVELAEELSVTTAELSYLPDRQSAYDNLAERTGIAPVKSVIAAMKQAEKHGASLGNSLRVMAQESRDFRMAEAEKKAAALPPKLTVPMIVFFLPVLFAVIVTPAAIQIMNS